MLGDCICPKARCFLSPGAAVQSTEYPVIADGPPDLGDAYLRSLSWVGADIGNFRPIDPENDQDRLFAGILARYEADRAASLSSNVSKQHATGKNGSTEPLSTKPQPPPLVGVKLKKTTSEVIRSAVEGRAGGGPRGQIIEISKSSIKNAIEVLTNADPELNSMIVVTYPETFPDDGRVSKAHQKSLRQAIERRYGRFSYFLAIEYQRPRLNKLNNQVMGAPHFHIALSIDLRDYGQVETFKRKKSGRRYPRFETVKSEQDWLVETWISIISRPNPGYNGVKLAWPGLPEADIAKIRKAYHQYNAGTSWEVMRDKDGAKKYLVKEFSGLKGYQKEVPEGFFNPGRHFLYSDDMCFDEDNALVFDLSEFELREMLERAGWKYLPDKGKPLYKWLWNSAADLAIQLIEAGIRPIQGGIEALRKYADLRMAHFADKAADIWRNGAVWADFSRAWKSQEYWIRVKKKLVYELEWEARLKGAGP